mgnify:CR=1 FL=1
MKIKSKHGVFDHNTRTFRQIGKTFKTLEVVMDEIQVQWEGGAEGPWRPEFAWRPRIIKGKFYWLKTIYKRERNVVVYPHQGYEYGDAFDAIRDA